MTTRKPLVLISGVPTELPPADDMALGSSLLPSNVIAVSTTIPVDRSYLIASSLKVDADLQVDGNLLVIG